MTAAERKAAERQRKRAAGLAPLEVWAPVALHDQIRRLVAEMVDQDWPDVQPKPHPLNMRGHKPDADGYDPYKWMHEQSEEVQAIEKARSLQHWKRMTAPLEDGEAD